LEITNGASTTSRRPDRMLTEARTSMARGSVVFLGDDAARKDWQMGLHGAIYGYRPMWWRQAIIDAVSCTCATSFAAAGALRVADRLNMCYPTMEAVRFMVNGSDPCAAAVKLARAVTGRDNLLVFGYHGTASAYCTPPEVNARPGLPAIDMRRGTMKPEQNAFVPLRWLDTVTSLDIDWKHIAALVVECPPDDSGKPAARQWLRRLCARARRAGALVIMDEVVTGFRYQLEGATGYYGLHEHVDLVCLGKTLGNGYPVAALLGKKDIMDNLTQGVHFSGTFFGEPIGMAVASAFLEELHSAPPWGHLYDVGNYLKRKWNALGLEWRLVGHPTRPVLEPIAGHSPGERKRLNSLRRYLFERGHIIVDHPWYVTTEHTKADVRALFNIVADSMDKERGPEWLNTTTI